MSKNNSHAEQLAMNEVLIVLKYISYQHRIVYGQRISIQHCRIVIVCIDNYDHAISNNNKSRSIVVTATVRMRSGN